MEDAMSTTQLQEAALLRQSIPHYRGLPTDASQMVRQIDKSLRILRMKQLVERTGLSRATLYVLMSTDPTFPAKIKLTARSVGFLESHVDQWIASRAAC
ncbi:helix-turn-helix transcriptional regulator [Ralstonia pseudosolanacearum]|uniref:helix-turn-helix transcriptional regulator n=2 Tax=Ralstonia pseudosolanacearum TaxID=1310165 RepID=UPI003CF04067